MRIITVNLPETFIKTMDHLLGDKALYPSRSELIRVAVREFLIREFQSAKEMKNLLENKDQIVFSPPKQTEIIIQEILIPKGISDSQENSKFLKLEKKEIIEKTITKASEVLKPLIQEKLSESDKEYAKIKARVKILIREITEINRKPVEKIEGGFRIVPKELINKKHELKMIIEENRGKYNFEPIIASVLKESSQILTNP